MQPLRFSKSLPESCICGPGLAHGRVPAGREHRLLSDPRPWQMERVCQRQGRGWRRDREPLLNALWKFLNIFKLTAGGGGFAVIEFLWGISVCGVTFILPFSRRVEKYFRKVEALWGIRCLYLILSGAVASGGVVDSLPHPKSPVLKCSCNQEPFYIFWKLNRSWGLKILDRQMTDRLWGGVGVGEPLVPGVTWQSQPQLSLEVFSLLQLEFVSPSSPYAGTAFLWACSSKLKLLWAIQECKPAFVLQAWCPRDDGAEQCKAGEDNKLRRGEQKLFVIA